MVAKNAQKSEEEKKHTSGDDTSSDDEAPELEEGGVTEDQTKVAEAAGLSDQVRVFSNY